MTYQQTCFLWLMIWLCNCGVLFSMEAPDIVLISRDSPRYKLEVRMGSGWVQKKSLSVGESGESAGWLVREFKPEKAIFNSLLTVPITLNTPRAPLIAYGDPNIFHITVYHASGTIEYFFVTSEKEARLLDGQIVHSDAALASWLSETLNAIENAEVVK